jgi:hypothetical protein
MVSPLCDNWALDVPYRWPYHEPDPFPPGHRWHALSQQIAMAAVCGWAPSFLAGVPYVFRDPHAIPESRSERRGDGLTRVETRIHTPLGDRTSVVDSGVTHHTVKRLLDSPEDYRRLAAHLRCQQDIDAAATVAAAAPLRAAVGERGVLGTWAGPPIMHLDRDNMWYHLADWPDACEDLHQAGRALLLRQLEVMRQAGFDYLFYCADGTEWVSPDFFRERILPDTLTVFRRWRELGGFVLWHSCGRVAQLLEAGFYNQCAPEVFETLSEPPVGNLPSLGWARERLDRRIATKGNLPLNILLQGSEDDVRAGVCRIRAEMRGWRHVIGLTDDVLAGTPLRNARAFVEESLRGTD